MHSAFSSVPARRRLFASFAESNHLIYVQSFHKSTCGMCAIWDLIQMGISAGKVVGRADGVSSIIEDAQILSDNIVIAKKCLTRDAYLEQMHFPRRYDQVCIEQTLCCELDLTECAGLVTVDDLYNMICHHHPSEEQP